MSIDFTVRKPNDLTKINSNNIGELLWWSYYFGTTPEKLLTLIERFGNSADEIRKKLTD